MTNAITINTPRRNTYVYYSHPLGTPFQNIGGNYMYAYNTTNGWEPVYIGQTNDLGERLTPNHHKFQASKKAGATHILTHTNTNEQARKNEEAELIDWLKPVCNDLLK